MSKPSPSLYLSVSLRLMGILQAIGLGLVIIVLRVLVPDIWNALEHTALSLLAVAGTLANHLQAAVGAMTIPPAL